MSTPDPKTVREIARQHIRSGHADIGTTIVKHFGNGALGDEEYVDWYHAVVQAWRVELRAVSWPDEQQPADVVTAEQQQDGAVGRVEAFLEDWPNGDVVWFATAEDVAPLTIADLRTVLAKRTALAERVAELEGERDAWKSEAERRSSERNAAVRRIGLMRECLNVPGELLPGLAELLENGTGRALSASETGADGSQRSGVELEFGKGAAGLSACCRATKVEGGVRHHCDSDAPHDTHECGDCAHRWDDTTEDGRHG